MYTPEIWGYENVSRQTRVEKRRQGLVLAIDELDSYYHVLRKKTEQRATQPPRAKD